jgi:hypothetical protein
MEQRLNERGGKIRIGNALIINVKSPKSNGRPCGFEEVSITKLTFE